jgi:hypothetical protein
VSISEKPQRSWVNLDDGPMRCYLGIKERITIRELIDHFAEHYPHVDPMTLNLNYTTAVWEEPPNADDLAKRAAFTAEKAQRHERWERETYAKLKAKFERSTDV